MKPERKLDEVYSKQIQQQMKVFYERLTEQDKRLYAGLEAQKLGHGGVKLVGALFGCCGETVRRGIRELEEPSQLPPEGRIRHQGGGRKGVVQEQDGLEEALEEILEHAIAGDPMNAQVKWTHLNARQIREQLAGRGMVIAENTVRMLLKKRFQQAQGPKAVCYG